MSREHKDRDHEDEKQAPILAGDDEDIDLHVGDGEGPGTEQVDFAAATQQGAGKGGAGGGEQEGEEKDDEAKKDAKRISASVGRGGANRKEEVKIVQRRLRDRGCRPGPIDGKVGPLTIAAIRAFQSTFLDRPDGRVDPGKQTEQKLFGEDGKVSTAEKTTFTKGGKAKTGGQTSNEGTRGHQGDDNDPPEEVKPSSELRNVKSGVKLTEAITNAYQVLLPFLPSSTWMTSGLRSDADQTALIVRYFAKYGGPASITDVNAKCAWLNKHGIVIARPGTSPHRTGKAFDLSGGGLDTIKGAVIRAKNEKPEAFHLSKTIVERKNNCLHVEVSG